MEKYRKSSHTVYDLKYHIVWITKYRKPVLRGEVSERVRELLREICKSTDVEIIKGHISPDHVHLFVSVPPHISVSKLVQSLKGKTSRKLMSEYNIYRAILKDLAKERPNRSFEETHRRVLDLLI